MSPLRQFLALPEPTRRVFLSLLATAIGCGPLRPAFADDDDSGGKEDSVPFSSPGLIGVGPFDPNSVFNSLNLSAVPAWENSSYSSAHVDPLVRALSLTAELPVSFSDSEVGVKSESEFTGKIVELGIAAGAKLGGYDIEPVIQGASLIAGLDVKSASIPGQILEGAAHLGVGIGELAAAAYLATVATDLRLGGSIIGFEIAGPPGAFIGGVIGIVTPYLVPKTASFLGDLAIDQSVTSVQKSMGAPSEGSGSREEIFYKFLWHLL